MNCKTKWVSGNPQSPLFSKNSQESTEVTPQNYQQETGGTICRTNPPQPRPQPPQPELRKQGTNKTAKQEEEEHKCAMSDFCGRNFPSPAPRPTKDALGGFFRKLEVHLVGQRPGSRPGPGVRGSAEASQGDAEIPGEAKG